MASSARRLPLSAISSPIDLPTRQLRPSDPTSTATLRSSSGAAGDGSDAAKASVPPNNTTSTALLLLLLLLLSGTWAQAPEGGPQPPPRPSRIDHVPSACCSVPANSVPSNISTPSSKAVLKSSVCSSLIPICRRSGLAPKSLDGGSRHRAPRALISSPHQLQRCSWLILLNSVLLSITVTRAPRSRSSIAARSPEGPAPTTAAQRPAIRPQAQGASA
mmetsp:Transcript_76810/g.217353  ORF Transcript_76810/g.217353 Transcript_76810/m.217353 type:complete len:218 (+) Transcript_76810:1169-1822(+)